MRALLQKTMLGVAISSSLAMSQNTWAAGMLQVAGDKNQAIRIIDHDVAVTINNGFAKVEVTQRFANPNSDTVEAVYNFPLPKSASLSEMSILSGETRLNGEVLPKKQAETIYEEQKSQGKEAGLAKQNSYKSLDFKVYPLMPKQDITVRFVYYQPVVLDTGVGRFVYPLSEGGTDEAGQQFWAKNEQVDNSFSIDINVKSAWPIDSVRAPNLEQVAQISHKNAYQWQLKAEQMGKSLNQDVVFYYRLADNLAGRVEVIPYKAAKDKEGTFMLVVTPGVDLKPLNAGADYTFVLDVSGSMDTKLATLIKGIEQTLGKMTGNDRFRVVAFNDTSKQIIPMTLATPDNVQRAIEQLKNLRSGGGTNLYSAVREGLSQLNADRVNNMILVTDGVTNQGLLEPKAFADLVKQYDLRIFAFVMGNNANWPLVRLIADASGGFYAGVSNDDDIVGQVLLAKSKVTSEALHHVDLTMDGVATYDMVGNLGKKIYRGQQIVMFGHYQQAGKVKLNLQASLSGQDKTYSTEFNLPEVATANPELERLWALAKVEDVQKLSMLGVIPEEKAQKAVQDLGVKYQIVTEETSMVVLKDDAFASRRIARQNQQRIAVEQQAQSVAAQQAPQNYRVDNSQPMFNRPAHSLSRGGGGGAANPLMLLVLGFLAIFSFKRCR